jgi:thymidine kinase
MSKHSRGSIELICGSMFSGKTEEMIRRLRRAVIARQQVQAFKPTIDQRYHVEKVTSHNGLHFEAQPVLRAADIMDALDPQTTVVAIDEAQFFDNGIIAVCDHLAEPASASSRRADMDFRGLPFGPMPALLARPNTSTNSTPSASSVA